MRIVEINFSHLNSYTCAVMSIFKKISGVSTFALIAFVCWCHFLVGQCSGNLVFNENQDIDSFQFAQGNCPKFQGSITLTGTFTATDDFFEVFDTILSLTITKSQLDSFSMPAGNLIYSYAVKNNPNLKKVSFQNDDDQKIVLDGIFLENNPNLTAIELDVSNMFNFYVKTDTLLNVFIQRNAQIRHHATTGNITYSGEKFKMWYQYDLEVNDSLPNFTKILEHFILDSIDNIRILNRKKFDCDGVENIQQINVLYFSNIDTLSLEGFTGVSQTINAFYMGKCHTVFDFQPMSKTKANYITLINNNGLLSLEGLPVSRQMYGLYLAQNQNLSDISRLNEVDDFLDDFIETSDRVWIRDNPKISFCSYPAICDLVVNLGPPYVNISGNVMDCLDNEKVKAACITSAEEEESSLKKPWLYSDGMSLIMKSDEVVELNIYDVTGKCVKSWHHLAEGYVVDVSFLPYGLYIVQAKDLTGQIKSTKWVKSK